MKNLLRSFCQKLLGYRNYLYVFALFSIKRMQWGGGHEKEFLYFLDMIPDNRSTVLDIGANIGVMAASIATKHTQAEVFAFEPIPDNQRTIERVVKHHGLKNIRLFKTALGDAAGEIKMVVPVVGSSNMQGLSHVVEAGRKNDGAFFTVPVQRLDQIPELIAAEKISAIKIDVENFEYYVLKGAQGLLEKHKPVIYCELWENERRSLCLDYIRSMGYAVKIFQDNALADFNGQEGINFFFVPKVS
ncbi:FkbM family methyltransferase [Sediminibacterium soli]|uniref:FkbM family methyltransferase n=1 Tax=Sediminibacterium soli TaxID=2698829 RepID=UPI001379EE6D|nr:FkbM family methyltransferase [Sediminibacterium soli]NCI45552.1 FkbM family methyltransferase [Sediminibacterium soli]